MSNISKSINNRLWKQKEVDENYILAIIQTFDLSDFLARLISMQIKDIGQINDFLYPKIKNMLPNPFHLLDMGKAVNRVIKAINHNEKICILGDYDVDGATSTALLKNIFKDLNYEVDIYIPDRILEGYGPSILAVDKLTECNTKLLITVDCGTNSFEVLEYAQKKRLEVIVIDHHLSLSELPTAVGIVNPNRIDESSKYKYLAAVGVSFLFAVGIISRLKQENYFNKVAVPNLMQYLDLVALGTVCDVMGLVGVNRAFVVAGLKIINQRQNLGINALIEIAKIEDRLTAYHLGYIIGPRINAGGRIGTASSGANLLSTHSKSIAMQIAIEIENFNNSRKLIEEQMLEQAIEIAQMQEHDSCLFVAKEGWHPGVIGIIASRLKDKFNKPVAVIAINNGIAKASCRSIKNIDFGIKIIKAKNQQLILNGGGHAMAAGFTAESANLNKLQEFLNDLFNKDFANLKQDSLEYNFELTPNSVDMELMSELNKLEPYGAQNSEPIFKFVDLIIIKATILVGKHINCLLISRKENYGTKAIKGIIFNAVGSIFEEIIFSKEKQPLTILGVLKTNHWQGNSYIQLYIKDIIIEE